MFLTYSDEAPACCTQKSQVKPARWLLPFLSSCAVHVTVNNNSPIGS